MTTPPRPSPEQVAAAIDRIEARRRRIDDPHQEMLSGEPAEVLDYLRKYSGPNIPDAVLAADIEDGIILRQHLWWQGEAFELWLLERAERLRIPRPRVAEMLGMRSGQGVAERLFRLRQKLRNLPPRRMSHPDVDRSPAPAATSEPARRGGRDVLRDWLAEGIAQLNEYAEVLIASRGLDLADDTYETVGDLRGISGDPGRGVPWWVQLTETAVALTTDPAVQALPPTHPLRETLALLDDLSAEWVQLRRTDEHEPQPAPAT